MPWLKLHLCFLKTVNKDSSFYNIELKEMHKVSNIYDIFCVTHEIIYNMLRCKIMSLQIPLIYLVIVMYSNSVTSISIINMSKQLQLQVHRRYMPFDY